jgi:hypothetical protein
VIGMLIMLSSLCERGPRRQAARNCPPAAGRLRFDGNNQRGVVLTG